MCTDPQIDKHMRAQTQTLGITEYDDEGLRAANIMRVDRPWDVCIQPVHNYVMHSRGGGGSSSALHNASLLFFIDLH